MIRVIGLLLVALTGAGAGLCASSMLHRRTASLEAAGRLMRWLSTRIRYSAAPVGELLLDASQQQEFRALSFLGGAAQDIREGIDPASDRLQAVAGSDRKSTRLNSSHI